MPKHPSLVLMVVTIFATLGAPVGASAQREPFGPIAFEEQSPLQRVSYTPMMEGADPVAAGRFRADVTFGYSNIFEQDSSSNHMLFLDMESLLTTTTIRFGLADGWEVGGRVTLETSGGGFLDSFLSWFHRALGVPDGGRNSHPMNAYHAELQDATGRIRLGVPQHALAVDDVRLFAKWRGYRSPDGRRVLSLRVVAEVPGDQNTVGKKRANLAVMALGRISWSQYSLFGTVGAATVRVGPELAPLVRPYSWFFMGGAERSLGSWVSAVGEVTVEAPRMRGFHDSMVDGAPINVVVGFSGRAGEAWRWNAGLQEDTPPDRPSVDFTLCAGVSRTW